MDKADILIIGSKGQLGTALQAKYPKAVAVDSDTLDITSQKQIDKFGFSRFKTVINAAAYTNVDGAETDEGRILAWKVNALGPANLTREAIKHGLLLVHISTDYVFDGSKSSHTETEDFSPLSVYGQTKAAADLIVGLAPKHYILRTSWVIGEGHNFVRTMLGLGQKGISPKVVSDQIGRLTFTSELVKAIDHILKTMPEFGTYNATNSGKSVSWADITRKIFEIAGFDLEVSDISTADYYADKPEAAKRPLNSTLDLAKLAAAGYSPVDWKKDLEVYLKKELAK